MNVNSYIYILYNEKFLFKKTICYKLYEYG